MSYNNTISSINYGYKAIGAQIIVSNCQHPSSSTRRVVGHLISREVDFG